MKDPQFILHNSHLESIRLFSKQDPQLRALKKQKYVYIPSLMNELPRDIPGIYTVTGGRQIGKTTLCKQWMQYLIENGVQPKSMVYFTGETVVDHLSLIRQIQTHIEFMPADEMHFIIIDEVTTITNWDMGIKFLADSGLLENTVLLITGSDSTIIQAARRFSRTSGKSRSSRLPPLPSLLL